MLQAVSKPEDPLTPNTDESYSRSRLTPLPVSAAHSASSAKTTGCIEQLNSNMSPHPANLSRREWLERFSSSALALSLGAGLLNAPASAAEPPGKAPAASAPPRDRLYDIRDFGAVGDGSTLSTAAVQSAIDACSQNQGGTVLVPAGDYVVGTLELKSNVTLHLAAHGRLLGSGDRTQYHAGRGIPRSNGNVVLLSAADADNVSIEGTGTIDGSGAKFFTGKGDNTGPGQNSSDGYFDRPHLLVFYRCRNLRIRDTFLTASAYHCVRILHCEHVHFEGVRIHNRVNKNNDGFHFNDCRYVHLTNCDVACQDDACALFGSNQFITVTNCTFSTRWSVFRFGGGHAKNIVVSNCVIYETYGCAIKMRCGANTRFENITFSNLIMEDVTGPISIGLDSTSRKSRNATDPVTPGIIRNIVFNGIRATVVGTGRQHSDLPFPSGFRPGETRTCITLNGVNDEMLENISFNDVHVIYEGGGTQAEAEVRQVPMIAGEYFEIGTPPAYGLYARNVRGLTLHNVRFEVKTSDLRPAVIFDHVNDAALNGLSAHGNAQGESLLRFINTQDVLLSASRALSAAAVFLRVEGADSAGITLDGGDLSKAVLPLELSSNATSSSVKLRV